MDLFNAIIANRLHIEADVIATSSQYGQLWHNIAYSVTKTNAWYSSYYEFTEDTHATLLRTGSPSLFPWQWRHNERDGVSNHRCLYCLLIIGSGADQRKRQSYALLAFVRWIQRWPVNSPHKRPVTGKMFPFDDVIMLALFLCFCNKWSRCQEVRL